MRPTLQIALIVAFLVSTQASATPVYNVTSGVEDYTQLVAHNLQHLLNVVQVRLDNLKIRHVDRMDSIRSQQQLLRDEIQRLNNTMLEQQAFSLKHKHCFQKYKPLTISLQEVNKNLTECQVDRTVYTGNADYDLQQASSCLYRVTANKYPLCNNTLTEIQIADCVTREVAVEVERFNSYLNSVETRFQDILVSSNSLATFARRCTFAVEKKALFNNGVVLRLSEMCKQELEAQSSQTMAVSEGKAFEQKLFGRLVLEGRDINSAL